MPLQLAIIFGGEKHVNLCNFSIMAYVQTKISSSFPDVLVWTDVLQKTNAPSSSDVWSTSYGTSPNGTWSDVWPWSDAWTKRPEILGCHKKQV